MPSQGEEEALVAPYLIPKMSYETEILTRLLNKLEKLQVITTEEKYEIAGLRRIVQTQEEK